MPRDVVTLVLRNVDLGHGNWLLEFDAEGAAAGMRPGQFFMIGVPGSDVLLRRPFSVCGLPGTFADGAPGAVQVLYRVYGRGTALLASLGRGARLSVLGPLGHGFTPPRAQGAIPLFVAGGIGSAPFPAFAAELRALGFAPEMHYGARTATELPLLDWFASSCAPLAVATQDGTSGTRGLVTVPLEERLAAADRARLHLYACGPTPMLKAVGRLALRSGVVCDLALEAPMACGFGVCLGCVLPTHGPGPNEVRYERVCIDGPVMRAERMAW
ncbi:MAG TPA: dihydroorotate dehydrogenase electron transfer subunit [Candidatus Polarisedimenticolaceae bacterium]|nr:dihydroorotate dehydrogenase electron transfer subunit [Candidatus Polarisedimenticolaceae bacterium]